MVLVQWRLQQLRLLLRQEDIMLVSKNEITLIWKRE